MISFLFVLLRCYFSFRRPLSRRTYCISFLHDFIASRILKYEAILNVSFSLTFFKSNFQAILSESSDGVTNSCYELVRCNLTLLYDYWLNDEVYSCLLAIGPNDCFEVRNLFVTCFKGILKS